MHSSVKLSEITDDTSPTVKTENCAVVLLCVLMDDTPTIDVMWIFFVCFSIYVDLCVQKMQVCKFFIVR